jgi:predicted lipoprotein with Yx(FWY)xxD motif
MLDRRHVLFVTVLTIGALVVAGCGAATPTSAPPTQAVPPTAAPTEAMTSSSAGPAQVNSADSSLGTILVDSQGLSLYMLTSDTSTQPACVDTCLTAWPPLLTTGPATAGSGVQAAMLGSFTRSDGSVQVTYNGYLLYTFKGDHAAGDVAGQGKSSFGGTWYVVSTDGTPVGAPASSSTSDYQGY